MPTLHLAQAHAAGGGTAYLYELTWPSPAQDGALGACHGMDGPLVLGNLTGGLAAWMLGPTPPPEAEEIAAQFRSAWTGFAATGNPGWPAYDSRQRLTRIFDIPSAVTTYPEENARRMWQEHRFPALPLQPEPRRLRPRHAE